MFFVPLVVSIPPYATGPALVIVGALMMERVADVDWGNIEEAVPAFVTVAVMPLTYSVAYGVIAGLAAHVAIQGMMLAADLAGAVARGGGGGGVREVLRRYAPEPLRRRLEGGEPPPPSPPPRPMRSVTALAGERLGDAAKLASSSGAAADVDTRTCEIAAAAAAAVQPGSGGTPAAAVAGSGGGGGGSSAAGEP